jgi:hypothetical protein
MMMEGSVPGSILVTNESGCGSVSTRTYGSCGSGSRYLELLSWSVCGVREVGYRILSHGALPLDLRSNAGILYVAACSEDDRQLLPGIYIFLVSVELQ